ncbi:MAG: penicillin acylase family protein [Pseudomonas sp.]|uniref:penicillin acylase family protein n=1 Tax=Pseudomonas sp. TaxID=306 RepID=UPI003390A106
MRLRLFRPLFGPLLRLSLGAGTALFGLAGCQLFLAGGDTNSLLPKQGTLRVQGLAQSAVVRRNALGMPLIETNTFHDGLFTLGFVHASDRLSQMVRLRLLAEGRLAELNGPGALDIDRFMRTLNLKRSADRLYQTASPRMKNFFEVYARGVNAYLFRYQGKLPSDLADAGHKPAYWKAQDSVLLFCLLNFGQAGNLQEELAALVMTQKVGAEQVAWLTPTYPDEPLPLAEAEKLRGLALDGQLPGLASVERTLTQVADLGLLGNPTSTNWAIAPANSRSGKSLLGNDLHLPLSMPAAWNFVQIRSPKFQAAGVTLAGLPMVLAGFNGKLAWSMSQVTGDNQDLFLEQIKPQGDQLLYLSDGKWQRASERQETFFIKGQRPVRERIFETRHGPLLNSLLGERQDPRQAMQLSRGYGLALQTATLDGDQSLDAWFALSRAGSVEQAFEATREVQALPLNLIFADAQHIGWQVTGRYPNRRAGIGLLPSPGWDSRYDWDGYADPMLHPYDQDPPQGWLGSANQRSVPHGYGMQLSNSWHAPERAERLAELAARGKQDTPSMIALQNDQKSLFVGKLQTLLKAPGLAPGLQRAIQALPPAESGKAQTALARLLAFDGQLSASSGDAALYQAFLHESARQTFLDELGPETSSAWQALVRSADLSYSSQADHLLGRDDSPFWNDRSTPQQEDKATILARSLAAAVTLLETRLGDDAKGWQWGKLHRSAWSDPNRTQPNAAVPPYPAGGDQSTLNLAATHWGQDFDAQAVSATRLLVDFARPEPMMGVNSPGQSSNPASPHYVDGIDAARKGLLMTFPFQSQNLDKTYGSQRLVLIPSK